MNNETKFLSGDFFLVTLKYTKQLDNGELKRVSENFLVESVTFGDAETKAFEYLNERKVFGDIQVTAIKRESYNKVILNGSETFFKMVVTFLSTDDKRIKASFLAESDKIEGANSVLTQYLKDENYQAFEIVNASLSSIKDVVFEEKQDLQFKYKL
jgi:hypothetical protein